MKTLLALPAGLEFTPGQRDRRVIATAARARRFAREWIAPRALDIDRRVAADPDYFPWDLVRAAAADGWLTTALPSFWGGAGMTIAEIAATMEEMCAACAGVANIVGAHGLGMLPVLLAMDLDLGDRVLMPVARAAASGPPSLCAFAITEPGAGSDVEERDGLARGDVRTLAARVSGGYRLTGRKVFISNGSVADQVVVFAALDAVDPASSWTAFVVRRGTPGFHCARVERKLGQRACPAAELVFDDVFVPADLRVGAEGDGWRLTRRVLAASRGPVGAIATGIARGAVEAAFAWVDQARADGLATAGAPWLDDALARMVVAVRGARAAYLEAAHHLDEVLLPGGPAQHVLALLRHSRPGQALARELAARRDADPALTGAWAHQGVLGAAAKIIGSDAAMMVTTLALDLVPPTAGEVRARLEKGFRDAKLTQIYEGTNQINRRAVAHESWQRTAELPVDAAGRRSRT